MDIQPSPKSFAQTTNQLHGVEAPINLSQTIVTPEAIMDPIWCPDFGATNHMTNSHSVMTQASTYNSRGKVVIVNGDYISISHVNSTEIPND